MDLSLIICLIVLIDVKRKDLRQGIAQYDVPEWGFGFPITGAYNIRRAKNHVSYVLTIATEKKPIRMNIKVIPGRIKKQQTKQEFQSKKEQIFNQLVDLLNQYKNN